MVNVSKMGLYVGEFWHSLTDRNRVALPKRIRIEIEGDEVILTKGFERCISGFDREQWAKMAKEQLATQFNEERGRHLRRQVFSGALIIEVDVQGRVVLPDALLTWTGLKGKIGEEVCVVGAGDHFEIWEKEIWELYKREHGIN